MSQNVLCFMLRKLKNVQCPVWFWSGETAISYFRFPSPRMWISTQVGIIKIKRLSPTSVFSKCLEFANILYFKNTWMSTKYHFCLFSYLKNPGIALVTLNRGNICHVNIKRFKVWNQIFYFKYFAPSLATTPNIWLWRYIFHASEYLLLIVLWRTGNKAA